MIFSYVIGIFDIKFEIRQEGSRLKYVCSGWLFDRSEHLSFRWYTIGAALFTDASFSHGLFFRRETSSRLVLWCSIQFEDDQYPDASRKSTDRWTRRILESNVTWNWLARKCKNSTYGKRKGKGREREKRNKREECRKMQKVASSTRHTLVSFFLAELPAATPLRTSNFLLFSWWFERFRAFSRAAGHFDFQVNALRASTSGCIVSMKNRAYRSTHIHFVVVVRIFGWHTVVSCILL